MKVRTAFVSNSSSSSFILIGTNLTARDLKKLGLEDGEDDELDLPGEVELWYHEGSGLPEYIGLKWSVSDDEAYGVGEIMDLSGGLELDRLKEDLEKVLGRKVKVAMYLGREAS